MEWYIVSLVCIYTDLKLLVYIFFLLTWELGIDGKSSILTCDSWRAADDTYQKNTLVQFFLHYNKNFVKCLGFWKERFACRF